jgi:hypothetical protein
LETGPVGSPHDLVVHVNASSFSEGQIDLAFDHRVGVTVGESVMDEFVHVSSEEVGVAVEPEDAQGGGVGKSAVAIEINPVDPLPSRIQQQLSNFARII